MSNIMKHTGWTVDSEMDMLTKTGVVQDREGASQTTQCANYAGDGNRAMSKA